MFVFVDLCKLIQGGAMSENKGVYKATKKNGESYYRVSITYKMKHISLGSFDDMATAAVVYDQARKLLDGGDFSPHYYDHNMKLPFHKFISLLNFRDNGIYFQPPIYLRKQYFEYYLDEDSILKFDRDDLFFFAVHTISRRGGYLYYTNYGSQYKLLSRYGIRPFAVYGRDYAMANGDALDFRYSNIMILNFYTGVQAKEAKTGTEYVSSIHINGNIIVGKYDNDVDAAIAYNKAVDTLRSNGFQKKYIKNYIYDIKKEEYLKRYSSLEISDSIISARP
jgi:hypothetical protein